MWVFKVGSLLCCVVLHFLSILAIVLLRKRERELVASFNLFMPNRISHQYQLDKYSCEYKVDWVKIFQFHSNMKVHFVSNSKEPDQTPCSVASGLVLHSLPLSQKGGYA